MLARPPLRPGTIALPDHQLVMLAKPSTLYGVARVRGEVLRVDGSEKLRTLEQVGTVRVLPYGAELVTCDCGRQFVSTDAMDQDHGCRGPAEAAAPPAPPTTTATKGRTSAAGQHKE